MPSPLPLCTSSSDRIYMRSAPLSPPPTHYVYPFSWKDADGPTYYYDTPCLRARQPRRKLEPPALVSLRVCRTTTIPTISRASCTYTWRRGGPSDPGFAARHRRNCGRRLSLTYIIYAGGSGFHNIMLAAQMLAVQASHMLAAWGSIYMLAAYYAGFLHRVCCWRCR